MKRLFVFLLLLPAWRAAALPDSSVIKKDAPLPVTAEYLNRLCLDAIIERRLDVAQWLADSATRMARAAGDRESEAIALMNAGNIYSLQGNGKGALLRFVRSLKLRTVFKNRTVKEQLYYSTAVALARMKQYPQSLKFFRKSAYERSMAVAGKTTADSSYTQMSRTIFPMNTDSAAAWELMDEMMDITDSNHIVIDNDTLFLGPRYDNDRSAPIKPRDITRPFKDGKTALAYAIMLHVKQPSAGRRKPFSGINTVGHMFITLVKFNADNSYVTRTFGFYPEKDHLLSATPLIPGTSSVFKDDEYHRWDELAGKFISKHKFNRILRMVRRYSRKKYNLNHNNCTDFGLCIAAIAGIGIEDTRGAWPLGGGNNPGAAGQSMLEGKVVDFEDEELFLLPFDDKIKEQTP